MSLVLYFPHITSCQYIGDPSVALLKRAIKQIYEYYDEKCAYELLSQFSVMLKHTTTVSATNKQKIQEELKVYSRYQQFLSQNPDVERIAQQREIEGKIEGKIDSILNILNFRFPNDMLIDLAKQALGRVHDIQVLGKLEYEALRASNEQDVHKWLDEYLPHNKIESKIEDEAENKAKNKILKILRRLQFSPVLLEFATQALSRIHDIEALHHLEDAILDSEDEQDVRQCLNKYLPQSGIEDEMDSKTE